MISYILKSWWRHKERFILLLIGAILISTGLSFLINLTETNRGTVINVLQNKWRASYDIVVRPSDNESITEIDKLLDPNYLSGTDGGITLEQYEAIKSLKDIEVAAPISIIGYQGYQIKYGEKKFEEPGIYRISIKYEENDGLSNYSVDNPMYVSVGYQPTNKNEQYGIIFNGKTQELISANILLLAAIDPVQEAKLVELDKTILQNMNSRYFEESDQEVQVSDNKELEIPVLFSNQVNANRNTTFTFEKLKIPFSNEEIAQESFEKIKKSGGTTYLEQIEAEKGEVFSYSGEEEYRTLIQNLSGKKISTGEQVENSSILNLDGGLLYRSGSMKYKKVKSPFPERWETSYALIPYSGEAPVKYPLYREPHIFLYNNPSTQIKIKPKYIGFYNPSKLAVSKDPTTELPLDTYYTPNVNLILDSKGGPVNPPKKISPTPNPFGYLLAPPTMLTNLEAARAILGEKPVAAIRIKVKNVESFSEESQQKLEQIAEEIEQLTGLSATITLGSSPQPVLTYIPEVQNSKSSGWVEQSWIKIGESLNIYRQTSFGYTGIIICTILVAIIYVVSTNSVAFLTRKREFAILLVIGWRPSKIRKLLWLESIIISLFVSILSVMLTITYKIVNPENVDILKLFLMILSIFIIYLFGAVFPIILAGKIDPILSIRDGEMNTPRKRWIPAKSIFSFVINTVLSRWKRNSFSVLAIALPTALLILFLFVSLQLDGLLFTSWLGQYVSMEVGLPHYVAMGISLLIAIITTTEILWQNISDRKSEIALLKAIGWKDSTIRFAVLIEGGFIGLISGILGIIIAAVLIFGMYGSLSTQESWIYLFGFIPVFFGIIAAWIPAMVAVKVNPVEGMRGPYR